MNTVVALLLDEMLSAAIAKQLRAAGLDAVAVVEDPQLVGAPDEDILEYATTQHRCVVTANISDFAALSGSWLSAGRTHWGIAYVSARAFPQNRSFIGNIVRAIQATAEQGALPRTDGEVFLRPAN